MLRQTHYDLTYAGQPRAYADTEKRGMIIFTRTPTPHEQKQGNTHFVADDWVSEAQAKRVLTAYAGDFYDHEGRRNPNDPWCQYLSEFVQTLPGAYRFCIRSPYTD